MRPKRARTASCYNMSHNQELTPRQLCTHLSVFLGGGATLSAMKRSGLQCVPAAAAAARICRVLAGGDSCRHAGCPPLASGPARSRRTPFRAGRGRRRPARGCAARTTPLPAVRPSRAAASNGLRIGRRAARRLPCNSGIKCSRIGLAAVPARRKVTPEVARRRAGGGSA